MQANDNTNQPILLSHTYTEKLDLIRPSAIFDAFFCLSTCSFQDRKNFLFIDSPKKNRGDDKYQRYKKLFIIVF